MKRIITMLCFMILTTAAAVAGDTYDVEEIYEKQELPRDAKILDKWDNIKEAKYILYPIEFSRGDYEVTLTRIDTNIYRVEHTDYIIVTKYCYEYAYNQKAILRYDSPYSYNKAKLTFLK